MKEQIIELVGDKFDNLNVFIDDIILEKEDEETYLRVVLDSESTIDLSAVVMASRILSALLDKKDLIKEKYMLDVYAKSKGENI